MIGDRTDLHRNGYQHPVVKIIDRMTVRNFDQLTLSADIMHKFDFLA